MTTLIDFPSSLYQHLDGFFSPIETQRSVQHWKLVDIYHGIYQLQDRPMVCELHEFRMDDRGLWSPIDLEEFVAIGSNRSKQVLIWRT